MRLNLQSRYMLTIIGLIIAVVVSLSTVLMLQFDRSTDRIRSLSSQSLENELLSQLQHRGEVVANYLSSNLSGPIQQLDMAAMYRLTKDAVDLADVEYVLVYDNDNRILHDATLTIDGFAQPLADFLPAGDAVLLEDDVRRYPSMLEISRSIDLNNDSIGGVRIGLTLKPILADASSVATGLGTVIAAGKRQNLTGVALTTGAFLLIGALLALMVSRGLVGPIRSLAQYASEVGKGNYQEPITTRRSDELGDLARSLHEMSQNLQVTSGEVHYLAYHDSLTRLPNRAQLKQALRQAISRAERSTMSVVLLFIDLDDFKRVNDTLGHEAGDTLLKEFAIRLRDCLREGDQMAPEHPDTPNELIARLGGDEFTVVLENVAESSHSGVVAQRVLDVLKDPFLLSGQEVVVGASIGVTTFPEDGSDVDTLLRNADVAMYQAKARGKNNFEFYNDSMHRMATERLSLEADLRHAIEYDQMRVYYQPVLDARSGDLRGVEALVRWMHPALGAIMPDVFIPLAEQTGFIVALDDWVVRRVCHDLSQIHRQGFSDLEVATNLSSVHFRNQSITKTVKEALEDSGLSPTSLKLEITEKTIMRNFPRASKMLSELREQGISIVVDSFGSGHSPLNYLTKLPVDGLKIASDYVSQIGAGGHEKAIVSTIVAMAHSLNLLVTAEGVENTDQIAILREIDTDLVQGSLFARPMLLDDLITYLERHVTDTMRLSNTAKLRTLPSLKAGI